MAGSDLKQRDDVMHALEQTMAFYEKELNDQQKRFWWSVLRNIPSAAVTKALADYLKEGKYAPKPAHIVEITKRYPELSRSREHQSPDPKQMKTDCPPEIARAWMYWTAVFCENSRFQLFNKPEIDEATQERYLHIINDEARKHNQPDAIPDEYKLVEYWGDLK